jgi:hypothetical protein
MPIAAYMAEKSRAMATASTRRRFSHFGPNRSAKKKPSTGTLATANHLSCWRSCPLARRNRTASDTAESVMVTKNASTTALAISLTNSHSTSSPGAPASLTGLSTNGKS